MMLDLSDALASPTAPTAMASTTIPDRLEIAGSLPVLPASLDLLVPGRITAWVYGGTFQRQLG